MSEELDIGLFAEKVGGQVVGGRVVGEVNGEKVYLTDFDDDGSQYMTDAGILLDSQTEAPAPKRKRGKAAAVEAAPVEETAVEEAPAETAPADDVAAADDVQIEV